MNAGLLNLSLARCTACLLATALCGAAHAQSGSIDQLDDILFDPQPPVPAPLTSQRVSTALPTLPLASVLAMPVEDTSIEDYQQNIAALELEGGPYAPALAEQYLALGEHYQQEGDHEAALATFEKADHVSRINSGLYSSEQFAIVENMIESHLARGELMEAGNRQRYLLLLHEEHYGEDSLELVPALETIADWNFSVFSRQLGLPNAVFTISFNARNRLLDADANDQSPRAQAFGSLLQSQANYLRAINILLGNKQYTDPHLRELEEKLIEATFLNSNRDGLMHNPEFYLNRRSATFGTRILRSRRPTSAHFFTGRTAYERLMSYELMTPGNDAVSVAETMIALGDWNLLFDRQIAALNTYRRVHDFLVDNRVPQETIDALLSPGLPQQLPVFTPLPNSRAKFGIAPDAEVSWEGYVDVSFRISRFGQAGHFEVLGHDGPFTDAMESRLLRLIRSSPFRPRFVDGEPVTRDDVTVRYYFAQM